MLRPDVSWGVREKEAILRNQKLHVERESSIQGQDESTGEPSGRLGRYILNAYDSLLSIKWILVLLIACPYFFVAFYDAFSTYVDHIP